MAIFEVTFKVQINAEATDPEPYVIKAAIEELNKAIKDSSTDIYIDSVLRI